MIVEADFFTHWKTQLLITLVAEAAAELANQVETQPKPTLSLGFSMAEPWRNPQQIQPEASPLCVQRLWAHCQMRKTWIFPEMTNAQLRAICAAPLPPDRWRNILLECRFIAPAAGGRGIQVHDWEVANASLVRSWANGKKGGRPKETQPKPNGNPEGSDREKERERDGEDTTRARARGACGGDLSTETAADPDGSFPDAVADAQKKVCGVMGNRRRTLGDLALRALGELQDKGELPRPAEDWAALEWFFALPHDDADLDLRSRWRDADKLALNLMAAIERAWTYAKKKGWSPGARTGGGEPSLSRPPANWRTIAGEMYPDAELPADWSNLHTSVRELILEAWKKEKGGGA